MDEFVRAIYVKEAQIELQKRGKKPTASNLSAITGLQRRDVLKYLVSEPTIEDSSDLVRRVIGMWNGSKKFQTKRGEPKVLTFGYEDSEFSSLVRSVSKDKNAATILGELERVSVVKRTPNGVRLMKATLSPREDPEKGFRIVARDISDLVQTAENNLFSTTDTPMLHVRTEYDKIREEAVPEICRWLLKHGHAFHSKARDFISKFDQDINPKAKIKGRFARVALGAFGAIENMELINDLGANRKRGIK